MNDFYTMIDFQRFFRTLRFREFFGPSRGVTPSDDIPSNNAQDIVTFEQTSIRSPFKRSQLSFLLATEMHL